MDDITRDEQLPEQTDNGVQPFDPPQDVSQHFSIYESDPSEGEVDDAAEPA